MTIKEFRLKKHIAALKRGLHTLRRQGPVVFLRYSFKYMRYGRSYFQQRQLHAPVDVYQRWIAQYETEEQKGAQKQMNKWKKKPLLSVITPVYNTDPQWLNACIQSVVDQWYPEWELLLYDDASTDPQTIACLRAWEGKDQRIKILHGKKNLHIAGASNQAIAAASGDAIALLDHDDTVAPFALYEVASALRDHPDAAFIYSDEDKIDEHNKRHNPFFKPDWSPDYLRSLMYTGHLSVYRKKIVETVGAFRTGFEGSQDYDLALRVSERVAPEHIVHIPKVLYHWRTAVGSTASGVGVKSYADRNAVKALREHVQRMNLGAIVHKEFAPGRYRVQYELKQHPLVSIIIPFRDKVEMLRQCVEGIRKTTDYPSIELLLVNNQSVEEETLSYLADVQQWDAVRVLSYDKPFNYSAINNEAVHQAKGEYVLLLNNDTKPINVEWLSVMMEHAQRPEVGAVGAKLLYPNDTIQHAGVVLGIGGIAGHAFKYLPADSDGYFGQLKVVRNCSAVTGACLLTKKILFQQVGGLDENALRVAFNDIDYCLKVRKAGYLVVYTPYAELYHFESATRGHDEQLKQHDPAVKERLSNEQKTMRERWFEHYLKNDPYYNPNLTRISEDYGLAGDPVQEQAMMNMSRQE